MNKYSFEIPFTGMMLVSVRAASITEAAKAVMEGQWDESVQTSFESEPENPYFVKVEHF